MKRNLFIITISMLAEVGIWAVTMGAYLLLSKGDIFAGAVLSGCLAGSGCLLVWTILEVNLRGKRDGGKQISEGKENPAGNHSGRNGQA